MTTIEFFYDVSSPWTYYAYARIEDFCAKNKAELIWKPFLVGAVFNKVNPSVYQRRESPIEAKDAYYRKDMADWARYQGLAMVRPSVFPVNSIKALRGAMDATQHPALLMVDTISSLASMDYRHDDWGVDVSVGGSQKGLMLPPGIAFNAVSGKALAAAESAGLAKSYFDWQPNAAHSYGFDNPRASARAPKPVLMP